MDPDVAAFSNSVDEVLQVHIIEEDEDRVTVDELLLPMVQDHSDSSCPSPPPSSFPSPPSSFSSTFRRPSAANFPASAPASFPSSSNAPPCNSLPSPNQISSALSQNTNSPATPFRRARRTKRTRGVSEEDFAIQQINQQLGERLTSRQHFLLSLDGPMDKVPEHLQGCCEMHLRDVVRLYAKGRVPTMLTPIPDCDDMER
ncbi:uncharacterized protein LOC144157955 [Haemaphysalis longicornis]